MKKADLEAFRRSVEGALTDEQKACAGIVGFFTELSIRHHIKHRTPAGWMLMDMDRKGPQ